MSEYLVGHRRVFAGTAWLALDASGFAVVNLGFVAVWLVLAWVLAKRNRQLRS